jgi:sec-independent protein translocase protein TatA
LGFLLKKTNFVKNLEMNTLTILSLSWQHILIVAILLVLLFGGKKIPELMRGVGSGIKEFKDAVKEEDKPGAEKKTSSTDVNNPSGN